MSEQIKQPSPPPIDSSIGEVDAEVNDEHVVIEINPELAIDGNNDDVIVNSSTSIGSNSSGGGGTGVSDNTSDVSREDSTNTEDSVRTLEADHDDSPLGEDNNNAAIASSPTCVGPQPDCAVSIQVTSSTPEKEREDENQNLSIEREVDTTSPQNVTVHGQTHSNLNNDNGRFINSTTKNFSLANPEIRLSQTQELVEDWKSLCGIELSKELFDLDVFDASSANHETPPPFPEEDLKKLDEMVNKPHWLIPVLPDSELEHLLKACIMLAETEEKLDQYSTQCKKFIREGMTTSFNKILMDDAVTGWKHHIQVAINNCLLLLIRLCAAKVDNDDFSLLELLSIAVLPTARFHSFNSAKLPRTVRVTHHFHHTIVYDKTSTHIPESDPDAENLFAYCPDGMQTRGWLVDVINLFGRLGGFEKLVKRILEPQKGQDTNLILLSLLVKPWGNCADYLTQTCISKYLLPIIEKVTEFLENMSDEDLKKETGKTETSRTDAFSTTLLSLKAILKKAKSVKQELVERVDHLRLEMILRLLRLSSFSGKMNALNELNKIISNVYSVGVYYSGQRAIAEDDWLNSQRLSKWIKDNDILKIVLKDNLHQTQYVDKLVRLLRFIIKEKALTIEDLNHIWLSQAGKHDIIVKNIYDLLAKVAWDFTPEQLDHLFQCFSSSWVGASKRMQEKLIEFIRRLAEDDKEGVMAQKVLGLLWNLAHSPECPTDILEQSLNALTKILEFSCSLDRETQRSLYIRKCIEELQNNNWVLPAIKLARDMCCLFSETPSNFSHPQMVSLRSELLRQLDSNYNILSIVAGNLTNYMQQAKQFREAREHELEKEAEQNESSHIRHVFPEDLIIDGHYSHTMQLKERLSFIRFIIKDGQLWLAYQQAIQIWVALTDHAVFLEDTEQCFAWFSRLVGDDPDLEGDTSKNLFVNYILQIKPQSLNDLGMRCFDKFFKYVNYHEEKLSMHHRGSYLTNSLDLVGIEYLWQLIMFADESISSQGIELLKEIFTSVHSEQNQGDDSPHFQLILSCMNQLQTGFKALQKTSEQINTGTDAKNINTGSKVLHNQDADQVTRCLTLLRGFFDIMDEGFEKERIHFPVHGRSARGRPLTFQVKQQITHGRSGEDFEIYSHTNDTLGNVRRQIQARLSQIHIQQQVMSVDLSFNGEHIPADDDHRLVLSIPLKDKSIINISSMHSSASSPDSSSDDEGQVRRSHSNKSAKEHNLPSVLFVQNKQNYISNILFRLCDFAVKNGYSNIRDGVRSLLKLLPTDPGLLDGVKKYFMQVSSQGPNIQYEQQLGIFLSPDITKILYMLEIIHALLLPSQETLGQHLNEFPKHFVHGNGIRLVADLLMHPQFLQGADYQIKKAAYLTLLKCSKLLFTSAANARLVRVSLQMKNETNKPSNEEFEIALQLQEALKFIPNMSSEVTLRLFAKTMAQTQNNILEPPINWEQLVLALIKLCWSVALGIFSFLKDLAKIEIGKLPKDQPSSTKLLENEEVSLAKEAIEVLCIILLLIPNFLVNLTESNLSWKTFVLDILLKCRNKAVRITAQEQLLTCIIKQTNPSIVPGFINILVSALETGAKDQAHNSGEYFRLLCRLLNHSHSSKKDIEISDSLLKKELSWLSNLRDSTKKSKKVTVEGPLLEGHLNLTVELINFQSLPEKVKMGGADGENLIEVMLQEFIMPASYMMKKIRYDNYEPNANEEINPICTSQESVIAAFRLIRSLCYGCYANLKILADSLFSLFYSQRDPPLTVWEHYPIIGPRPIRGFVGLKNAGATCYMNSVIQQLYMLQPLQAKVVRLNKEKLTFEVSEQENGDNDTEEDTSNAKDREISADTRQEENDSTPQTNTGQNIDLERKNYHISVLAEMQSIFGHLKLSKLQYHAPNGFWRAFKLWGETVNLKEQHDALEFYNSLVDSIDEGMKIITGIKGASIELSGTFASQKICKDCPHRYNKEEPFTALSVEVRNQCHLQESLDLFVKGDLLEGNNAFFCEKCDRKVDTIMRTCIRKLPKVMVIQLKRFDYDWEREQAIKFNDYFEFPREFDFAPYTEYFLAKKEGEEASQEADSKETVFTLTGIVVHSGQAYGGHYYSFIKHKPEMGDVKWFKFDDVEVSECRMEDYEELRSNCFGGEFQGEIYDPMSKRMQYRRQKRWWNAYLLIYRRVQSDDNLQNDLCQAPLAIFKSVQKENLDYMHSKVQFGIEYFGFMKELFKTNKQFVQEFYNMDSSMNPYDKSEIEDLALLSVNLASKFLFNVAFHSKKSLRGLAGDWFDGFQALFNLCPRIRKWFADEILFKKPMFKFAEYLLDCPGADIRLTFSKMLVCLAKYSNGDGIYNPPLVFFGPKEFDDSRKDEEDEGYSFSLLLRNTKPQNLPVPDPIIRFEPDKAELRDHILGSCINLLSYDLANSSKHLSQYFNLFLIYAKQGRSECEHLLRLNAPELFMASALHEGPGPPIISQALDLSKLFAFVAILVRCYDVSHLQESAYENESPIDNPHKNNESILPLPESIQSRLFLKPSLHLHISYVKKMMDECPGSEECITLLKFCCWENWDFSMLVLGEIIFELSNSQNYELRQYMDLMLYIISLEDSWQMKRIHLVLHGMGSEIDSLFHIIQSSRMHYQKRAYLSLKLIIQIAQVVPPTKDLLTNDFIIKRRYTMAVDWLNDELNKRIITSGYTGYGSGWPHGSSNETSTNSLMLERTNSAQNLLMSAQKYYVQEPEPAVQTPDSPNTSHFNDDANQQEIDRIANDQNGRNSPPKDPHQEETNDNNSNPDDEIVDQTSHIDLD